MGSSSKKTYPSETRAIKKENKDSDMKVEVDRLCACWHDIVQRRSNLITSIECLLHGIEECKQKSLKLLLETYEISLEKKQRELSELDQLLVSHCGRKQPPFNLLTKLDKSLSSSKRRLISMALDSLKQLMSTSRFLKSDARRSILITYLENFEFLHMGSSSDDPLELAYLTAMWKTYNASADIQPEFATLDEWPTRFFSSFQAVLITPVNDDYDRTGPKTEAVEILADLFDKNQKTILKWARLD